MHDSPTNLPESTAYDQCLELWFNATSNYWKCCCKADFTTLSFPCTLTSSFTIPKMFRFIFVSSQNRTSLSAGVVGWNLVLVSVVEFDDTHFKCTKSQSYPRKVYLPICRYVCVRLCVSMFESLSSSLKMMNNNRIYGIISEINGIENVWISNELDTFVNGKSLI